MTLEEFCELESDDMFNITYNEGIVMGSRENNYFTMTLYRIEDFYVEVKRQRSDGSTYMFPIYHDVLLHPYLDQVDISKLFQ